jgi:hypothetical protein
MQDRKQLTRDTNPFGLRMDKEVRQAVEVKATELDRSLNWTINHLLKQALGLKEPTP